MNKLLLLVLALSLSSFVNAAKSNMLLSDESNTVEIFKKSSAKIVYVHRAKNLRHAQIRVGSGSGIIWDKDGHIITNYHVIKGADAVSITMDGITIPAKIMGVEPRKDLAVLALDSKRALSLLKSYKPFVIADSNKLLIGQKAIAIGNPFGLDHSLSVGIISALGRQIPGVGGIKIYEMIQTDAAINPGNSGGALLDSSGRLLGLTTAIYSSSGSSAGVGFAVPATDIARIVQQIIKNGRVVLAGIGVEAASMRQCKRLGIKRGLVIARVLPHSPAARAGLCALKHDSWGRLVAGDVIMALNAHKISNYAELYNIMSALKVGTDIDLMILRDAKYEHVTIKTIDIAKYMM